MITLYIYAAYSILNEFVIIIHISSNEEFHC